MDYTIKIFSNEPLVRGISAFNQTLNLYYVSIDNIKCLYSGNVSEQQKPILMEAVNAAQEGIEKLRKELVAYNAMLRQMQVIIFLLTSQCISQIAG